MESYNILIIIENLISILNTNSNLKYILTEHQYVEDYIYISI